MNKTTLLIITLFSIISLSAQTWVQKADFSGPSRLVALGLSGGHKGYVFSGRSNHVGGVLFNDLWEFNPVTNAWRRLSDLPSSNRTGSVGFSVDTSLFIGLGFAGNSNANDFYEYKISSDTWHLKANFPGNAARTPLYSFLNGNFYVIGGETNSNGYSNEFWKYNINTNTWTQLNNHPLGYRSTGVSFCIDSLVYFGLGHNQTNNFNDLWSYNPSSGIWTQLANFPGQARKAAISSVLNDKVIVGGGQTHGNGTIYDDYYVFNPQLNRWDSLPQFTDGKRSWSAAFTINDSIYVTCGRDLGNGSVVNTWMYSTNNISTGQVEYKKEQFDLFPNPSSDLVYINSKIKNSNNRIQLFDSFGKLVLNQRISNNHVIDLNKYPIGIYIYRIINNNKSIKTGKLIKQ